MKADDAILAANFLRLKREGFTPSRDLILALTSDEEGGAFNGVEWLLKNHRSLIDAAYCINTDAGGGTIRNGRPQYLSLQAAEKTFRSFKLEVTNAGGHSSLPTRDNAIYHLAEGLSRLAKFDFPVRLNEVTHSYFERMASIEHGQQAADMKAVLRTPPDAAASRDFPHPLHSMPGSALLVSRRCSRPVTPRTLFLNPRLPWSTAASSRTTYQPRSSVRLRTSSPTRKSKSRRWARRV